MLGEKIANNLCKQVGPAVANGRPYKLWPSPDNNSSQSMNPEKKIQIISYSDEKIWMNRRPR